VTQEERPVNVERINPASLMPPHGHTHVVKVNGGTTLHLSGQGAYNSASELVGADDHYAQTRQAFENVLLALAAARADWRDVVKATFYVVGVTPDSLDAFVRAMRDALGEAAEPPPASTFVGVAALAYPDMLVEIDVTAVTGGEST
jgi:enamine deaminase RidA (YjgF/YER057c/UK114 family)